MVPNNNQIKFFFKPEIDSLKKAVALNEQKNEKCKNCDKYKAKCDADVNKANNEMESIKKSM